MSTKTKKGAAKPAVPSPKETAASQNDAAGNSQPKKAAAGKSKKADPEAIMKKLKTDVLYENDRGEFFTNQNYALISVGNDKGKLTTHRSGRKTKEVASDTEE